MRQFQYPRSPWVYLALACVALMFVISGGAFLVLLARLFVYLVVVYMLAPAAAVALVYLAVRALAKRTGWGRRHLARLLSRRQAGDPEVGRYETSPADPSWEPPATPPPTWPASPVPPPPAPAPAVPVVEVRHVFVGPDVAATMSQPSPFAVPAHPQNCTCHGSGVVACPWSQAAGGES